MSAGALSKPLRTSPYSQNLVERPELATRLTELPGRATLCIVWVHVDRGLTPGAGLRACRSGRLAKTCLRLRRRLRFQFCVLRTSSCAAECLEALSVSLRGRRCFTTGSPQHELAIPVTSSTADIDFA